MKMLEQTPRTPADRPQPPIFFATGTRRDEPVYNLEVHREHVYLVGSAGTLVHNNCPNPLPLTGRPHGGTAHDAAIMDRLARLGDKVDDVRKNQAQVNALGEKVSNFRPDLQWTQLLPDGSTQRYYYQAVDSNLYTRAMDLMTADPKGTVLIDLLFDTGQWRF